MDLRLLNRIFAFAVFLISLVVFLMTVQPTVSFWDCGEFIAAAYYLQVPHPPGAPLFLIVGNIFSKIPLVENIGYRVNLLSVLTSALSIFFLYLIIVKVIQNYLKKDIFSLFDALVLYISAAIGALAFTFSDTFWFNAVEAEVYASSTFLFAAVTYLIMRWNENPDKKDSEKYIILIAYLIGLSTGVHLMSVLAIVPVVMIVMFRKYVQDEEELKKTGLWFLAHAGIVLLVAIVWWAGEKTQSPPTPEEYQQFDSTFKIVIALISALIVGINYKKLLNRNSFYMPLIIGGIALFATYPGVVKYFPALLTLIGGENIVIELIVVAIVFGILAYLVKYSIKESKPTLHLVSMSMIFILIGFTTFAMVIIRANQNPPMNENEPNTFPELEKYLNREQYGDFPTFKRRFSSEPHQQQIYTSYSSDLDFFYSYQMNHMMTRYLLWNFAGREGWVQDMGANVAPFNGIANIFGKLIGVEFRGEVKDSLFGIPFLLGLIGIYFHFRRDWKMASVYMIMFILMGYLTAFYQNQQEPQPRERDYFYVGAFFVFAIWISIGVHNLVEIIREKVQRESVQKAAVFGTLTVFFVLIPVKMLSANYFTHDRSRNYVAWDYSYNLLQTCAPNSILFTNGDNDTFPLWYLQDVEGVRRDVKIVNLSLLNTEWYIRQLKNNDPYNVGTVRIRFSDEQIQNIRPSQWKTRELSIPLPKEFGTENVSENFIKEYNVRDSSVIKEGKLTWTMPHTLSFGDVNAIRVQDIMVREIIEANNWQRPIYFAVTCSDDSKIGLQDYLRMEGMAFRLVPERRPSQSEFVEPNVLAAQLKENPSFSREFKPGFKFRGLNDSTIFLDDNHRRMIQNYRNAFIRMTLYYLSQGQNDLAVQTLDEMENKMPRKLLPMEMGLVFELGNLYKRAGSDSKYIEIANEVEKLAVQRLEENPNDVQSFYNPYRILLEIYEDQNRNDKLYELWKKLEAFFPNDPSVKSNVEKYRQLLQGKDTTK
jgi:hypothetical protein